MFARVWNCLAPSMKAAAGRITQVPAGGRWYRVCPAAEEVSRKPPAVKAPAGFERHLHLLYERSAEKCPQL